ncbi:MAG TPA: aspartate aminotransferase family protein [Candidatus Limnocylindrales bacterium]|nr:aspartate aminotransferase family protein [Candidatus Limnocylindrales bacterium]
MNRKSKIALELLRGYESRNVTFIEPDGSWPIVWERAKGVYVWDAEGREYLDLTAAFGVAATGHANPRVVSAGQRQMARLLHAMGDVHPHELKAKLARELSRITFERWGDYQSKVQSPKSKLGKPKDSGQSSEGGGRRAGPGKTIFCNSGFEAVEAALKTAMLATGKARVIAFEGAYHGLGYGALNATHRAHFRSPFRDQLREFGHFVPFPSVSRTIGSPVNGDETDLKRQDAPRIELEQLEATIRHLVRYKPIGAILVEPIQVRGGINVPPPEFLPMLRAVCDGCGALLILDEIYTGLGRTGKWFACEHTGVVPDLICLGKALTGGFPLSACVGRAGLMDSAWPPSEGEAIHTSTFLGHPVGCAMALAQLREINNRRLVRHSKELGEYLLKILLELNFGALPLQLELRGQGLLAGLEIRHLNGTPSTTLVLRGIKNLLQRGYIFLPEGEHANVLGFTPPLTISRKQLESAVGAVSDVLRGAEFEKLKPRRGRTGLQR